MDKDIAIKAENVSKKFRIPHERINSLRGAFINVFKANAYEEFKALDDVSFEVKRGEFLGIIGRNGSGKSTLLKILAGIYQPDKGRVHTGGMISPFLELGIGFNTELSGRDNIFLNATVLGLTRKQIEKKFDEIVAFSELERFIDQKLKNYSSGMKVRLAFSVAIHANRDILLMDEVLAVGDMNFQRKCLDSFRALKKEGKTIVLVSHNLEAIKDFSDRAMILNEGKIAILGNPDKIEYEYAKIMLGGSRNKSDAVQSEVRGSLQVLHEGEKNNYIKRVYLVDDAGLESSVFREHDPMRVVIELEVALPENDMFVSVGMFDAASDVVLCGNNMYHEKLHKNWSVGKNVIKLVFKDSLLHKGRFYLRASFFKGDPGNKETYDYYNGKERFEYFSIAPDTRHQGLIHIPHVWEF